MYTEMFAEMPRDTQQPEDNVNSEQEAAKKQQGQRFHCQANSKQPLSCLLVDKSLVRSFRRKKSRGGGIKKQHLQEGSKVPPKRLEDLVPGKRSKDWWVQKQPGKQEGRTQTGDPVLSDVNMRLAA